MEEKLSFYEQYKSAVRSADLLLTSPEQIKAQTEDSVADIKRFGEHLIAMLPELSGYPSLQQSLFALIGHDGMTGYLGEFIIDEAIAKCRQFSQIEQEINEEIGRMRGSATVNPQIIDDVTAKMQSWRRVGCNR